MLKLKGFDDLIPPTLLDVKPGDILFRSYYVNQYLVEKITDVAIVISENDEYFNTIHYSENGIQILTIPTNFMFSTWKKIK